MKHIHLRLVTAAVVSLILCLAAQPRAKSGDFRSSHRSHSNSTPNRMYRGPEERLEFISGVTGGDISYTLAGMGNSGTMRLGLRNKTETSWLVAVEIGTEFEPTEGNAQRMVVTTKVEVHVHPHEHSTVEVDVNCLDISRPAPSTSDTAWTARRSSTLGRFLECANTRITAAKRGAREEAQLLEAARPMLIQFSLWSARGATREQWIDFWVKYQGASRSEAVQLVDAFTPVMDVVTNNCGELTTL